MIDFIEANMSYLMVGLILVNTFLLFESQRITKWIRKESEFITQTRNDMGERFRDIERRHEELNSFIAKNVHIKKG